MDNTSSEKIENRAKKPLSDSAILSKLLQPLERAIELSESEIGQKQAEALRLYNRDPYKGDESLEGRSKHVSGDATNAVHWMSASLLKIMDGQSKVVQYLPRGPEDEALADQQTEVVNYIMRDANSHVTILQDWINNGLICGLGIVTAEMFTDVSWSPNITVQADAMKIVELYRRSEAGEIRMTGKGDEQSVTMPDGQTLTITELQYREKRSNSRVEITSIPPETFIVSKDACFDQRTGGIKAHLQGYWRNLPRFELIEMGFDRAKVNSIPKAEDDNSDLARRRKRDLGAGSGLNDVHEEVRVYELFMRMDVDQDGSPELVRITLGGEPSAESVILNVAEVSLVPFAAFSPQPLPNSLFGKGIPHQIEQEMRLSSFAKRSIIDNLVSTNNPIAVINSNSNVDINDLLDPRSGKVVRTDDINGLNYWTPPNTAASSYQFVGLLDDTMEQATGVGRNLSGLDAASLKTETATGVTQRANSAQMIVEMTARMFCETGYRYLFRIITSLLIDNAEAAAKMTARLRNGFVPIITDSWDETLDLRTNVAFGVADKNQTAASLQMILANQMQFQPAGMSNAGQIYQTLSAMLENAGYRNPERFFTDPAKMPPQPPAPPPPDPAMMKMQADMEIAKAKLAMDQERMAFDQQLAQQKLAAEIELNRWKAEAELQLRTQELAAESAITAMKNPSGANVPYPD